MYSGVAGEWPRSVVVGLATTMLIATGSNRSATPLPEQTPCVVQVDVAILDGEERIELGRMQKNSGCGSSGGGVVWG